MNWPGMTENRRVLVDTWEVNCSFCGKVSNAEEYQFIYANGEIREPQDDDIEYPSGWEDDEEDGLLCAECISAWVPCEICGIKDDSLDGYGICMECSEESKSGDEVQLPDHFCSVCRNEEVSNKGDICAKCEEEKQRKIERRKSESQMKYGYGEMRDVPRWGNGY